jgi:hypothetical protein
MVAKGQLEKIQSKHRWRGLFRDRGEFFGASAEVLEFNVQSSMLKVRKELKR